MKIVYEGTDRTVPGDDAHITLPEFVNRILEPMGRATLQKMAEECTDFALKYPAPRRTRGPRRRPRYRVWYNGAAGDYEDFTVWREAVLFMRSKSVDGRQISFIKVED